MQAEILTGDTHSGDEVEKENVKKEKIEVAKESLAKVATWRSRILLAVRSWTHDQCSESVLAAN